MSIPGEKDCFALLDKYNTPEHIVRHSQKVWAVGRVLGEALVRRAYPVDLALIRASCLLHDIGKFPCIVDGKGHHDLRGGQILEEEGFPAVARIVVQHVVLKASNEDPVREEHVVFYADKRVVHDEIVSLDDRFVYLWNTYGKIPLAEERLSAMKEETVRLERAIFLLLDFEPQDVIHLVS